MTVFSNGGPPITADNANQWVQTYENVVQLRGQIGAVTSAGVTQLVALKGFSAPGDGGQGTFWWNANSIGPDDGGLTTVLPFGSTQGAWVRNSGSLFSLSGAELKTPMTTGTYYLGPQGGQTTNAYGWVAPSGGIPMGGYFTSLAIAATPSVLSVVTFTLVINGSSIAGWSTSMNSASAVALGVGPLLQVFPASANVYILAVVSSGSILCTYALSGVLAA